MTFWNWLKALWGTQEDRCDTLNIPPALFRKWMLEVAQERKERG